MATVAQAPYSPSTASGTQVMRSCGGCHNSVDVDAGGIVVAFGNSLWHVECFKCAKCGNRVSADTNLLLLSDGSPVCAACSYNCSVCKKPISDEAIMTGDESYHSACFTCKTCGRHIGELVFAKTSQGIYCMSCHNDRVARSRRHAEQRRNRSKSRRDKDKERLREKPSSSHLRENGTTTPDVNTPPTTPGLQNQSTDASVSYAAKRVSTQSVTATLHDSRNPTVISPRKPLPPALEEHSPNSSQLNSTVPSPTTASVPPPSIPPPVNSPTDGAGPLSPSSSIHPSRFTPPAEECSATLPLPESGRAQGSRRKSFDDGVRPLNGLLAPEVVSSLSRAPSTNTPRSNRADKRSSINPALRSEWTANKSALDAQLRPSPSSLSPTADTHDTHDTQRLPRRSHNSEERSVSPHSRYPHKGTPDSHSPTADSFSSPPSSPSFVDSFYRRSHTDSFSGQSIDLRSDRSSSLPDTARPLPAPQDSQDSVPSPSGQTGPHDNEALNGTTSAFTQSRQSLSVSELPWVGTPQRKLPKLPVDETRRPATDEEPSDEDEDEDQDQDHTNTTVTVPIALPPMSFHESDTSFQDLLKLGSRPSTSPRGNEKVHESHASRPGSRQSDAGPSKPLTSPSAHKMPSPTLGPQPRRTESPHPLRAPSPQPPSTVLPQPPRNASPQPSRNISPQPPRTTSPAPLGIDSPLPPRNTSLAQHDSPARSGTMPRIDLARKMSARKPVPRAILLPATFDSDMTLDRDDPSNAPTSPKPDSRPERRSGSNSRPYSAGAGPPPLSPRSAARRSSDRPLSGSSLAVEPTPTRSASNPVVTVTETKSDRTARPGLGRQDTADLVAKRIKETLADALQNSASTVRLDREFLEAIYLAVQASREKLTDMRGKYDGMKRTSQQVIDGLSVAQVEYDMELAARREAEAEVTRLKVQLSGQAARLTELSAVDRKREMAQQISRDMSANIHGLERDLSRLKAERDLTVAEVEELAATKTTAAPNEGTLQRSLTSRFDSLKAQYKRELEPLLQQREALIREINELKEERNICLEETTALNARNEELAELNRQTTRKIEAGVHDGAMRTWQSTPSSLAVHPQPQQQQQQLQTPSTPKSTPLPPVPLYASSPSLSTTTTLQEEHEPRTMPPVKLKGWFKPSREAIRPTNEAQGPPGQEKEILKHNFQQLTVLRLARCDQCGEKMWGTHLRCHICNFGCHNRCVGQVTVSCVSDPKPRDDAAHLLPLQPSMFGRDLIEQVRADSTKEHRDIPVIVEKCILAVELLAMDYEGIYRKTGGSSQSKAITQLFERGNYDAFDLNNPESFNDISSVTSVLKTYFRQLPNPLLTHALHDAFVSAATIREPRGKADSLGSLVYQLPSEHFHTLRYLMLHLYRVQLRCSENLMNARNLGVVFGPTLMRSKDPNREFADMAGKALAIEWLIENAPTVFRAQDE